MLVAERNNQSRDWPTHTYSYNSSMGSKTFNLSLPKQQVAQMDEQAKRDFSSRSDFVRKAVVNQLRAEQSLQTVFDRANARGKQMGITSEQQVYDLIAGE